MLETEMKELLCPFRGTDCKCVGSSCAAWRWNTVRTGGYEVTFKPSTTNGHCLRLKKD